MAELRLGPEELDRLEDALEDLEFVDFIDDPSTAVRARLADYREILLASREALPLQDVPAGILAGVLAEARADPHDELLPVESATQATPRESWWTRVGRSFLIPSLAVVGTAALILVIVRPQANESAGPVVARTEPGAARLPGTASEPRGAPTPTAAEPPAADAAQQQPAEEAVADEAEPEAIVEIATARRPNNKLDEFGKSGAPAVAGGAKAEDIKQIDAQEPNADASGWEAIERGDKARKSGDCFRASNEYHRALDDGNDSIRARALAGLGLCAIAEGSTSKAEAFFDEARALDPEVGGYIGTQEQDAETKPKARPAPRKKQAEKSRRAAPPSYDDNLPADPRNANPFKE